MEGGDDSARLPPLLPGYSHYAPSELCQPVVTTNICVRRKTIQVQENRKYYTAGVQCMALRCVWGTNHGTPFHCLNINGLLSSSLLTKTLVCDLPNLCYLSNNHVLTDLSSHMEHLIT
jgi:hypothetical protein